ncbi:MAG: hypothetical protein Kow0042_18300 [Calditrichia bacterium]
MGNFRWRAQTRFIEFATNFQPSQLLTSTHIIYLLGWIISFGIVFQFMNIGDFPLFLALILFVYLWFKLLDIIHLKIRPPSEILIILLLIFAFLNRIWIHLFLPEHPVASGSINPPGFLPTFIQYLLMSLLVLLFSALLVENSRGKRGTLFWYAFLGYLAVKFLESGNEYLWIIFVVFLLLNLLRKTAWTEELTRAECWIYMPIFLLLYIYLGNFICLREYSSSTVQSFIWFYFPKYLLTLIRFYLLAVLIKIPFVLVYHHARLSRKLRIAGIFQSNVPQLIQLVILLLFFYFFIGGWQAENLRSALENEIELIKQGHTPDYPTLLKVELSQPSDSIGIPQGGIFAALQNLPDQGIVNLNPSVFPSISTSPDNFFLFFKSDSLEKPTIYFLKIDSLFLSRLTQKFTPLAASQLVVYPFQVSDWNKSLYTFKLWNGESRASRFRIFPFGILPHQSDRTVAVPWINELNDSGQMEHSTRIRVGGRDRFTTARVYIPLMNQDFEESGYCAFDIIFFLNWSFLTSPVAKRLLFWLVVYLLVNIFVIRQAIKFGNRIHQRIVQKFNQLKFGIRQISEGNLDFQIQLEGEDEFVELAERFNQMGGQLKKTIEKVRQKDRLEYELKIAREVQLSLLPKSLPQVEGYQIAAGFRTANEVGGDFYDVLPLASHQYLFVIGDISGKSTSAAFYMAQCLSLIRFARQFSHQPREILLRLNRYFSDPQVDRQIFLTAILGVLDTEKNRIQLYRAGHPKPILVSNGAQSTVKEINLPGLGIGLERTGAIFERSLKPKNLKLKKGDCLVLFTDGVVETPQQPVDSPETPTKDIEFLGENGLMELLRNIPGGTAQQTVEAISRKIDALYGDQPPLDDYTLLVIQREKEI